MIVLENTRVRAEVDPARGGRLVSLRLGGHEVLGGADPGAEPDDSIGTGCYPMVPWAGRLAGHPIHGSAREVTWTDHGEGELSVELIDADGRPGVATLGYLLLDDGLEMQLAWHGSDDGWCSLGFHPWFRRSLDTGTSVDLDVRPLVMTERGPDHLPTGRLIDPSAAPWDDCFRLEGPPRLTWGSDLAIELRSDADWWVVFDASRDAVCVEPQTAPPDAVHHDALRPAVWPRTLSLTLRVVSPADTLVQGS